MNDLTIIIPSKTAANLKVCVKAIRDCREVCEIMVVDDGVDWQAMRDPDGCIRGCGEDGIWQVKGAEPFVFARNCNLGIAAAKSNDVILLNDDALLTTKRGFTLMQKEAEANPDYGCIGAVTNVTGQILQKPQGKGLRQVHHIAFVCVFIPRRTIDKIGMLDERYCIDYGVEDRDYCEMITRAGMKVGVHDGCFVDHSKLTSSYRGHPMAPGRSAQNRALFLEKFGLTNYFKFR